MKKTFALLSLLLVIVSAQAQKFGELDKSPMDMAYYPDNFAHDRKFAPKLIGDTPALVRVIYGRPAKKGREVFGKLIPFNEIWRAGANEATEIRFYKDATFQGKTVKAGTYSLFIIPTATEWTLILNTDLDQWGAYSYNVVNDILRVNVPVKKSESVIENFSIQLTKRNDNEAMLKFGWDTTLVEVPISF
jgi:Protein of unknown function (DUF2911)